jgi:hypothetical protein
LAGILDGSGRIRPERRITGHLAGILDGFDQNGRTPGIWPETGQDGRLPATLLEFVYAKYKKIFLYYFILIFFIL